ncbi:hypothetical protein MGN01_37200 [Methylobacterium gnaphalii]|uniref:FAS1 domain-containing protein n=1 Tax=Methylobacterium gnaphalii TaxID=1010610 RepID=A0A512JPI6_9HYPH|nr:hypothetical protein MGN01_37200 [Methylobacterium gnaphalii]GLS47690.1 hypothetical protein GCM10007885_05340 [Methylobacterium gnaphalii]
MLVQSGVQPNLPAAVTITHGHHEDEAHGPSPRGVATAALGGPRRRFVPQRWPRSYGWLRVMDASKTISENAVDPTDHTTFVVAVRAAGLVDTLSSASPFTVFVPTSAALGTVSPGAVDTLPCGSLNGRCRYPEQRRRSCSMLQRCGSRGIVLRRDRRGTRVSD